MSEIGRVLVLFGIILIIGGIIVIIGSKFGLGKLPGDIFMRRDNWTFYFPIATSIILSIILTIILNLFFRR
jgi:low affinity Fe/Cu permease